MSEPWIPGRRRLGAVGVAILYPILILASLAVAPAVAGGPAAEGESRGAVAAPAPDPYGDDHHRARQAGDDDPYVPPPAPEWATRSPEEAGFDADALDAAIDFALEHESEGSRDLGLWVSIFGAGEPHNEIVGPTKERGPMSGLVLKDGYIVAEWGPTRRVDMTFSVTKSFLSSVAGVAWDRGLIRGLDDPVAGYVPTDHFDGPHNSKITWDHLLRQTSEWQGTLWGKPDWADRPGDDPWANYEREPAEPGTRWKYNDVRVNALALALLHVWREPLPEVLKEEVMEPIGASNLWRWYGYENSWITLDGLKVQSVSGGGHWGGGMWITARDLARFGLLSLRRGRWGARTVLSREWVDLATTPTGVQPTYGFMNWFLNTDRELLPSAPTSSLYHAGAGANVVYVDFDNDLVVVVRWIDREHLDGFIGRVLGALR